MQLGMYTAELRRESVEELFGAALRLGFELVQFSFASVLSEELPPVIDDALAGRVRRAADAAGVAIAAVNGTFNMAEADGAKRAEDLRRFEEIVRACGALGCGIVTLCTGSRNRESMWRWSPENDSADAWETVRETVEAAVAIAEKYGVTLGVEPEASNVVNSPERARKLLDSVGSPRLKIIFDPANLFQAGEALPQNVRPVLERAFDLLGGDICLAHGKDITPGEGLAFTSAGRGIVDFAFLFEKLRQADYTGGIILHGMKREEEFAESVAHIRKTLALSGKEA
ncbi:sugar phosphate isomerase/epimerase [Oscillospiraceae bacterium OttesenSCG-928-F05]|nr:sugar phosphate isomerase/epimerase [Oscillospiraceae bacterium OttesenSCG-928-F05]